MRDAFSDRPLRMRSTTSRMCTILDVNMVAGSCFLGTFASIFGHRHVLNMNRRLNEADDMLAVHLGDLRRVDRQTRRVLVFVAYLLIMVTLLCERGDWRPI